MEIEVSLSSYGTWDFRETALTLWDLRREAAVGGGALGSVTAPLLEVDLKEAVAIFFMKFSFPILWEMQMKK